VAITFLTGDCRDILPTLADASVQCVVTSPPRDYGTMAAARYQADAGMFADTGTATLDESYDRPIRDLFAYAAD
jgi:hypothetical protein